MKKDSRFFGEFSMLMAVIMATTLVSKPPQQKQFKPTVSKNRIARTC